MGRAGLLRGGVDTPVLKEDVDELTPLLIQLSPNILNARELPRGQIQPRRRAMLMPKAHPHHLAVVLFLEV